jgi:hypothetical protein
MDLCEVALSFNITHKLVIKIDLSKIISELSFACLLAMLTYHHNSKQLGHSTPYVVSHENVNLSSLKAFIVFLKECKLVNSNDVKSFLCQTVARIQIWIMFKMNNLDVHPIGCRPYIGYELVTRIQQSKEIRDSQYQKSGQ